MLELVGGVNMAANLRSLATGGRIAVIGVGAGLSADISLLDLMARSGVASTARRCGRSLEDKAAAARAVERHVLPLLARGAVTVPIAATFPLAEAADAYAQFAAGGKFGKIVLLDDRP